MNLLGQLFLRRETNLSQEDQRLHPRRRRVQRWMSWQKAKTVRQLKNDEEASVSILRKCYCYSHEDLTREKDSPTGKQLS